MTYSHFHPWIIWIYLDLFILASQLVPVLRAPPGMEEHICSLTGAMGAMERINNTPLPFAYVSHLRTCLVTRQGAVVGLMGAIRQVPKVPVR
jgi:hypothetical protein